jgi:hypothetical protein
MPNGCEDGACISEFDEEDSLIELKSINILTEMGITRIIPAIYSYYD